MPTTDDLDPVALEAAKAAVMDSIIYDYTPDVDRGIEAAINAYLKALWRPIGEGQPGDYVLISAPGGMFTGTLPVAKLSRADRLALAKDGDWPDHKLWTPTHFMHLLPAPSHD